MERKRVVFAAIILFLFIGSVLWWSVSDTASNDASEIIDVSTRSASSEPIAPHTCDVVVANMEPFFKRRHVYISIGVAFVVALLVIVAAVSMIVLLWPRHALHQDIPDSPKTPTVTKTDPTNSNKNIDNNSKAEWIYYLPVAFFALLLVIVISVSVWISKK